MQDVELDINEIFFSIQGESSHIGQPCIFIRLSFCNLRCSWCDSEYTFYEGKKMTLDGLSPPFPPRILTRCFGSSLSTGGTFSP